MKLSGRPLFLAFSFAALFVSSSGCAWANLAATTVAALVILGLAAGCEIGRLGPGRIPDVCDPDGRPPLTAQARRVNTLLRLYHRGVLDRTTISAAMNA